MNILFQWLQRNISVVFISRISLISLILSVVALERTSTGVQKQKKWYIFKKIWSTRNSIFHAIILICLTCYVISNWEKCISMQFFSQFNGNNILFLVWIIDILLFFYEVEIKEGKLHKRKIEKSINQVQDKHTEQEIEQRVEAIDKAILELSRKTSGGGEEQ